MYSLDISNGTIWRHFYPVEKIQMFLESEESLVLFYWLKESFLYFFVFLTQNPFGVTVLCFSGVTIFEF